LIQQLSSLKHKQPSILEYLQPTTEPNVRSCQTFKSEGAGLAARTYARTCRQDLCQDLSLKYATLDLALSDTFHSSILQCPSRTS